MKILFIIILFVFFTYLIVGVFDIRKNIFIESINSVERGNICLTFDDGPDPIMTPKILDVLKKYSIKGTFFLIGENVCANQELVRRISDEGHSIGNHTYYHKATFPIFSKKSMTKELKKSNDIIQRITKKKIRLFRCPFGISNIRINTVLKRLNLTSIGWDIRSLDTVTNDSVKLYNKVKKGIDKGGSIILFHDRCKSTLAVLEDIIIYCLEKNLRFKTIDNA